MSDGMEEDDLDWVLIGPKRMQRLLDELPHRNYREVGNKLAVQIRACDYDRFGVKL